MTALASDVEHFLEDDLDPDIDDGDLWLPEVNVVDPAADKVMLLNSPSNWTAPWKFHEGIPKSTISVELRAQVEEGIFKELSIITKARLHFP